MSTLRVSNIEAKADPSSSTVDEQVKITNSNGDVLLYVDGRTSGITTVGINTTAEVFKVDSYKNFEYSGIITAASFSGPIDASTGTFSGDVTISGNLGVAGTITYEDVARVDATGISTFREGFGVGPLAGIALTAYSDGSIRTSGIITASSFSGTVASSNLSGALPALDGSALTGVGASFANSSINTSGIITATAFIPSAGQLSHRNLIINGAMRVAQKKTSETSSNGIQGYTTVDRWKIAWAGANNIIEAHQHTLTSSDTGPYELGFRNAYKLINGAQSGADAGDEAHISYRLEAQDIANSGWNYTSSSSYITLSFWVKSSVAQTFHGFLLTADGTQQLYSFSLGSLSANTWTKVTKTIPGNSNLQFDDNTAEGLLIRIALFRGTSKTGTITQNQWAAFNSNIRYPNYTSTWWTTNDAEFELTGVQLEVGSVATPFEHRSYSDELLRCKRYFNIHSNLGTNTALSDGFCWSANEVDWMYTFPVEMRATPSVYQVTGADYFKIQGANQATYVDGNWTLQYGSKFATSHYGASDSSRTAGTSMHITFNNAAARLGYNAEL